MSPTEFLGGRGSSCPAHTETEEASVALDETPSSAGLYLQQDVG